MLIALIIMYIIALVIGCFIFDSFGTAAIVALIFIGIATIGPSPTAFEVENKTNMDAVRVQEMLNLIDKNK